MRNNMDDLLEFTIPDWAISSLINGDDSGLEEEDIEKIDKFVNRIVEKYGNANFILPYEDEMDLGFQGYNDIDKLGSDCSLLYLRPSKPYADGGTTNETIYIYNDEEYSADELIELANEMAHYDKMDYGEDIDIWGVYSAIAFLGEDEVKIKGNVMMDGGMIGDRVKVSDFTDYSYHNTLESAKEYADNLRARGYEAIVTESPSGYEAKHRVLWKKNIRDSRNEKRVYYSGGVIFKGGRITNQYDNYTSAKQLWDKGWNKEQRLHFLSDHSKKIERKLGREIEFFYVNKKFDDLFPEVQDVIKIHFQNGQYADGGMMAKGGVHKVNKKYAYFAVNKKTNKIVDGWEIVDDVESLKYYAKMDLKDNDLNPKDYNLLSAKTLKARGIDPYSWDSWAKTGEYRMGGATFQNKVDAISESLEGRKVKPSYRKAYGKTYNKMESVEAAKRIAGAMRKKEMARKK